MQQVFPHIAFRREVTVGHLLLDTDCECAVHAKVNPPIRPREDVEALWQAVLDRKIDWIVSDHACCSAEQKWSKDDPNNIWLAKSGFGGTEYLLSGVLSEGSKRGMSYNRMAELLSWTPAQRFGLLNKGDIAPGYDADIVIVDPHESFVVRAAESQSEQGYTPFEGLELTGRVKSTFLRGTLIYHTATLSARRADAICIGRSNRNSRPLRGERPHDLNRVERARGHCRRGVLLLNRLPLYNRVRAAKL